MTAMSQFLVSGQKFDRFKGLPFSVLSLHDNILL